MTARPSEATPPVRVNRSTRRTKTVSAHFSGDTVVLAVPHNATARQIEQWKHQLVPKIVAKRDAEARRAADRGGDDALMTLAKTLSTRYLDAAVTPTRITWSARQRTRWGSTTPATGTIRISTRLQRAPQWVLETVVLHELAHLIEAHHNERFYALANRHPRAHAARAFLDGVSWADAHPGT